MASTSFAVLTAAGLCLSSVASLVAQNMPDKELIVAATASAEKQHWPTDHTLVISSDRNLGIERSIAARLNAGVGSLRQALRCEQLSCRLPQGQLFVVFSNPIIEGNMASVYVETWRTGKISASPIFEHVLVRARKSGNAWHVVSREVIEIS